MILDISDRIGLWIASRSTRKSQVKLTQNNIYIFPSRVGLAFMALLVLMLLTAINYQNSLIYLFTFFLGALFFISIWLCFLNVSGLQIRSNTSSGCFVGEPTMFELSLLKDDSPAYAISLSLDSSQVVIDKLNAGEVQRHSLLSTPKSRGVYQLDRLYLRSDYPFGFIKAWTWQNLTSTCYVYPKPIDGYATKEGAVSSETNRQDVTSDEISDIKDYQAGANISRILWKRYAARDELALREHELASIDSSWVRWTDYNAANVELKLSYMCFDVLALASKRECYGLSLPGMSIQPESGEAHKIKCLQALAAYRD